MVCYRESSGVASHPICITIDVVNLGRDDLLLHYRTCLRRNNGNKFQLGGRNVREELTAKSCHYSLHQQPDIHTLNARFLPILVQKLGTLELNNYRHSKLRGLMRNLVS